GCNPPLRRQHRPYDVDLRDAARADGRGTLPRRADAAAGPARRADQAAAADRGRARERRLGRAPPRRAAPLGRRDRGRANARNSGPRALRGRPAAARVTGLHRRARPLSSRRERKVVTVLFADLVGFTSRAESLDPEDVEAILRPYHERLRATLEHFGGTVEKFIGDAVMAVFGAPTAHEDDPERAVRAALAVRDWIAGEG